MILKGHAYRPQRNPYGRKVFPGCECGAFIAYAGAVTNDTARFTHREHKAEVARQAAYQRYGKAAS
jgi:hypothetical protein